jgi:hypothetical protein
MAQPLDVIMQERPPVDGAALWNEAIVEAMHATSSRGARGAETPAERLRRMRDSMAGELVAFHEGLVVAPYEGDELKPDPGTALWDVGIPVTLFPKRDHGFGHVECLVEFRSEGEERQPFRVMALQPEERSDVLAKAEMGATLRVGASGAAGAPMPAVPGASVAEAAAKVYGQVEAGVFDYEIRRHCTLAEIVAGTGARWRLDDLHDRDQVRLESHQLAVVLAVDEGAGPIAAAGCLEAYSKPQWLSHPLEGLLRDLGAAVRSFFTRGAPSQAYAEWEDILG